MAKLKAPLFSFSASGKIADALVYFTWKGLNVVRQYVVPANPKTTLQTTHRGYLTAAVALVHQAEQRAAQPMNELDQVAYALLGSLAKTPRTWFNQCVKLYIDVIRAADDPGVYRNGFMGSALHTDARPVIYFNEETLNSIAAGTFHLGISKTNLNKSVAADITVGSNADVAPGNGFDDLVEGTKYYWQFRPDAGDPAEGADSGIYTFVAT